MSYGITSFKGIFDPLRNWPLRGIQFFTGLAQPSNFGNVPPATPSYLLQEDSSFLLQEDGFKIELE